MIQKKEKEKTEYEYIQKLNADLNICKHFDSKCEHNREKRDCKECRGSGICEHNRRKPDCNDCHGSQICEHDREKRDCKECHGSGICEHNRRKRECKRCSPKKSITTNLITSNLYQKFNVSVLA